MSEAALGKLKNLIPSLGHKQDNSEVPEALEPEDNSRGEKVGKKQHDVLLQLSIKPQTQLDAQILTPSKLKKVGFHLSEEEGYNCKEVEDYHDNVMKTVNWFADRLYERDRDVHKLATEVDKYITDYQSMKLDIELLESAKESQEAMGDIDERIEAFEKKIEKLERENATLKSKNELLGSQLAAYQNVEIKKEEPKMPSGELTNAERAHLEALEQWAVEVNVMYEDMEAQLAQAAEDNEAMEARIVELTAELEEAGDTTALQEEIETLKALVQENAAAYNELLEKFESLEKFADEAEQFTAQMEEYSKGLQEELENAQGELESTQSELEKTQAALQEALANQAKAPVHTPSAPVAPRQAERSAPVTQSTPSTARPLQYSLPEGVDLDDL